MTIGSIKEKIESTFVGSYAVSVLHAIECAVVPALVSDEKAVKRFYKRKTGKDLNLENPQSFSEKMNWYKLNHRDPVMQQCADKVAVREYVKSKGYGGCLNELYGVYDKVSDIDINALPDQFALKASHGSHMNYIVKDKAAFNWKQAKIMMRSWLRQNIYWSGREWVYKDIPHRIIAEKYLEDETGELKDYKFFCFNGKPYYMQFDGDRFINHYRNFYDMDKKELAIECEYPGKPGIDFPLKAEDFESMKKMARDLAKPFQHVRVDFYLVNGEIYFGELTFFHNSGITWFQPEDYDEEWGKHWSLE